MSYRKREYPDQYIENVVHKHMMKMYWKQIEEVERQLEMKYQKYRRDPSTNKNYQFYCRRFDKYHKNSGKRWKEYWNEKLSGWHDEDLKAYKSRIWDEIQTNFAVKKEKEEEINYQKCMEMIENPLIKAETLITPTVKVETFNETCSRCKTIKKVETETVAIQTENSVEIKE